MCLSTLIVLLVFFWKKDKLCYVSVWFAKTKQNRRTQSRCRSPLLQSFWCFLGHCVAMRMTEASLHWAPRPGCSRRAIRSSAELHSSCTSLNLIGLLKEFDFPLRLCLSFSTPNSEVVYKYLVVRGHLSECTSLSLLFLISLKKSMLVKKMKIVKIPSSLLGYWDCWPTWYFGLGFQNCGKGKAFLLHKTDKIICKIPKGKSGRDLKVSLRDPHSTSHKELALQNLVYLLQKEKGLVDKT